MPPRADPMKATLPTFRKETAVWAVAYGENVFHLPPTKGLAYLSRLVAAPGARIRASDLAGKPAARVDDRAAEQDRVNVTKGIKAAIKTLALYDAALARHLEQGVRTGKFCCYLPVLAIDPDPS